MRFMDAGRAARRRRRLLRLALGLYRRGRLRDFGPGRAGRGAWRARCSTPPRCCRSGSAPATACGWRPGFAFTATTSTPRRRRSRRALEWSIQKSRRAGGARAGGFPGARADSRASSPMARRAAASDCAPEGRAPVREGAPLFADAAAARAGRRRHLRRLRPQPQRAGRDGLSARRRRPPPARRCSPKCAASACRCGSRRCPSFPTPYKR